MFTVLIRGLEFYAHHGVPDEEQAIGHRYKIDLELDVDGGADRTDNIAETVDYAAVAANVLATSHAHRCRTVERLARIIADRVLQEFPSVERLTITLVKRMPPAPIIAEEAGVRLTVAR